MTRRVTLPVNRSPVISAARAHLAYLSGVGPPNSPSVRAMRLADPDDGLSFTVLGARIICHPSWVPDAGLFVFKIAP